MFRMSELQHAYESESEFSASDAVYTHFRSINNSQEQELSSTVDDHSIEEDSNNYAKLKTCVLKCCEIFLLLILITMVWLALSIPSVFFAISQINKNSSNFTPTVYSNSSCKPTPYTGKVCSSYLRSIQNCSESIIYIPDTVDQEMWETQLKSTFHFANFLASDDCKTVLKPLSCLYFFNLCDSTMKVVAPTAEQCSDLQDRTCKAEWDMVENTDYKNWLPKCDSLPSANITDSNPTIHCDYNCTSLQSILQPLNCSIGFISSLSPPQKCSPSCSEWSPYTELENQISNAIVIIAGVVAIISGIIVLIFSCVRCKKLYSYPSIFVIYQTIPTIILGSLALIAYLDKKTLFCGSDTATLRESVDNPTPFCTLTGVCLYYIMMQLILLWLFHVITMCWGVYWPIQANIGQFSPKVVFLHVTAVVLALILPAFPVLIIYFLSLERFTITRFPPILCTAKSLKFNYYAFMLPSSIIIASGLTMLVLIFWKLIKKRITHHIHQTRIDTHWCVHTRILTVFCYFVIFGIIVLSTFTVSMINVEDFLDKATQSYFDCESEGHNTSNTSLILNKCMEQREEVSRLVNPIITIIALVVLGFYPAVNLIYVCHVKEIKKNCSCCGITREVEYTQRQYRPYSHYQISSSDNSTSFRGKGVRLDTHGLI